MQNDWIDIDLEAEYADADEIVETRSVGRPGVAGTIERWSGKLQNLLMGPGGGTKTRPSAQPSTGPMGLPSWVVPVAAVGAGVLVVKKLRKRKG